MELLLELFMTAFVAICISFLVAKLVSAATTGADDIKSSGIVEEVKMDKGLKVKRSKSKKKVTFVVQEDVKNVDKKNMGVGAKIDELVGDQGREVDQMFGNEIVVDQRVEVGERIEDKTNEIFGNQIGEVEEKIGSEVEEIVGDQRVEVGERIEDETNEILGDKIGEVEEKIGSEVDEIVGDQRVEVEEMIENERDKIVVDESGEVEEDHKDLEIDDGWEGIERSELEEDFAIASNYIGDGGKEGCLLSLGSDVQMQLYGLHKVATEGPCHEAQPMALKVSARAKWNAWQSLGNMTPEAAMEKYINILSNKAPGWMQPDSTGDGKADATKGAKPDVSGHNRSAFVDTQPIFKERKLEVKSIAEEDKLTGGSNSMDPDKD